MQTIGKKTTGTFIYGVGSIEVEITKIGKPEFLKEIELFVTQGNEGFTLIVMKRHELRSKEALQSVVQYFINHIQEGGEFQTSNLIRKHFRNWINTQNGNLKNIINGTANRENTYSTHGKGGNLSSTAIIKPDKSFNTIF